MDKNAGLSPQNRFSVLARQVIDPVVDDRDQVARKIKVPPITFTELQRKTILAELKIEKFSFKIISTGRRLILEDVAH